MTADPEMRNINPESVNIDNYRKLVQTYINMVKSFKYKICFKLILKNFSMFIMLLYFGLIKL